MSAAAGIPDVLARIADDRRRRVAELKRETPGHVLRARLGHAPPAGRLERALRRPPNGALAMICEIKRRSPSKGLLREAIDPAALARTYQSGGAAAISVVTEPDHFGGELAWIDAVRGTTTLPVLLKDFVVDEWQLADAATRGADAVLLIVAMHAEAELGRLLTAARLLGLDALVEVHTLDELQVALRVGATVVGINNRDLHTFAVDPGTSLALLPRIPTSCVAVAESGLSTPEDLARLRATRCDAVLMGEVFMTSADPAAALHRLAEAARG